MHLKRIHEMIESLTECAESAIKNDQTHVGKYPISEVIDMIKDLSEAEYHCKITKAMEEEEKEEEEEEKYLLRQMKEEYGDEDGKRYYDEWRYSNGRFAPRGREMRRGYRVPVHYLTSPKSDWMSPDEYYRDMDRATEHKMYYTPVMTASSPTHMEHYESNYDRARRGYEEAKSMHMANTPEDKQAKIRELEKYMNELSSDITSMIAGATPEEKTMLKTKMQNLSQKI